MGDDLTIRDDEEKKTLSIFTAPEDQTVMDISKLSDFLANGITQLANSIVDTSRRDGTLVSFGDIAVLDSVLKAGGVLVRAEYEYILDFDSLPRDILQKYREGKYKLGESRQVKDNLRAVIVDETGQRVKDVTLKKTKRMVENQNQLQNVAIQMQLKQIIEKLDTIIQLQDYHVDFSRNNALVKPFFDARDYIIFAQNEPDQKKATASIEKAIEYLTTGLNAIYVDLDNARKHFLLAIKPVIRIQSLVNRFIKYMTQNLHLLSLYNGVLFQLLDYCGRYSDLEYSYGKYKGIMNQFYREPIGRQKLPVSLLIHNAVQYSKKNLDAWKTMTDEIVPMLSGTKIETAYIISGEEAEYVQEKRTN